MPIMCGIADYTSFITRVSPAGRWGVLSFDLERYGVPLTSNPRVPAGRVWYGIPDRQSYEARVILKGLETVNASVSNSVLWFQHEFGIWPGNLKFISMLKQLDLPKVVTFHTIHFQSTETSYSLRREQYDLLRITLPYVDAITVFSRGVHRAVTSAFPEHHDKVYIIKHGIHSYPEVSRLTRRQAKEKLNDYLLYESGLDRSTKEALHRQRVLLDRNTVVLGQTGFLCPSKSSELLYTVRDNLQKQVTHKRIAAIRIGSARDDVQKQYADELRQKEKGKPNFLLETWLPQGMLPVAQRAFDINFHWPRECTQSGVLSHALGAGAVIAGRDMEGVGETLKDAGEITDTDLRYLVLKMKVLIRNPELFGRIEESALQYAADFSWANQAQRHYELADGLFPVAPIRMEERIPPKTGPWRIVKDIKKATDFFTTPGQML
jgi:hypothetical protein